MTNQMVSRFRVKKLSPKHPLPIYKEYQLPDLTDATNVQRAVPQIETGVEKEEEEEHDLQAAMSAAQAAVTTGASVENYIPTPDASRLIPTEEYVSLYKKKYKEPSTLIRFSSTVEDCVGCPYVMDEEDEVFLNNYIAQFPNDTLSEDSFEKIMWECESITNQQWPHLYLDATLIADYKTFMDNVPDYSKLKTLANFSIIFDYWRTRRLQREGKSIIPQLKFEEILKNEADPYVCFRRRETKPIRKTRRTDQQSLERLRKLRSEMEMSRNLLGMVLRREKTRKEGLVLEHNVFEQKRIIHEYQRTLGIKEDDDILMPKKKRHVESSSGATIKIPLHKLNRIYKSPTQLAMEAELNRKRELDLPYNDVTDSPYQPFPLPIPQQFYQTLDNSQQKFRKRMGRNGRVFIDRMDYEPKEKDSKYRFDSDASDGEDLMEIDEMDSLYLKHRVQLLSETELRNLVTVPFLTPLNMININQARQAAAAVTSPAPVRPVNIPQTVSPAITTTPLKRQNSRTKMTPQQAAVAMANGMIAANMAAVVNGTSSNKAAMQMAMAAAQQQQHANKQQQQQQQTTKNPPLSLHF
ncbi:enhancer of polycomb-like-domain-containing protein [Mucor mucedo]|uniref:enhancer of polycomb-like-domain-containing protein n=1 Tax=Mucor mucedo TaxID=29922 RepID=UPI00221FD646|nr:enhancer of polycomb-like-domain-containing protein [Mucor mucedo]KAI7887922.1 enhancer of polycomb-like-domain-containing protein [Mucor mucedo]